MLLNIFGTLPSGAYAPELFALRDYLAEGNEARMTLGTTEELDDRATEFDLKYMMMGFSPRWSRSRVSEFHDYASLATGRCAQQKDVIKRVLSARPVARSFLNSFVRSRMKFRDGVPSILRDMGVPTSYLRFRSTNDASYDLVYVGSVTASRGIHNLAEWAVKNGVSLLLVGEPDSEIATRFGRNSNVSLVGRVMRSEVPDLVTKARFAVNYTPAIAPFDKQTSTKTLEYLALGMRVITNDYGWVRAFEVSSGARMFKFSHFPQLNMADIEAFQYVVPDMSKYQWSEVWRSSGISSVLRKLG